MPNHWIQFVKKNAGKGKSLKDLSKEYKSSGCGLSGGTPSGGKVKRKIKSSAQKGALADLLKGLNANINVK